MALFSMRDSWNVWRRKVDEALGGSVEPIKGGDVTYDNTTSGLTATNVQNAIDEVAGELSGITAGDVAYDNTDSGLTATKVQGAIDEINTSVENVETSIAGLYREGYTVKFLNYTYTSPGSETYSNALHNACAGMYENVISTLNNDERVFGNYLRISGVVTLQIRNDIYSNDVSFFNMVGNTVSCDSTKLVCYSMIGYSGTGSSILTKAGTDNNWAFADLSSNTVPNGTTFSIEYFFYKKV